MLIPISLNFDQTDVRMIMRDGDPWWVGIDVAAALGIVKAHQALATLEDYERGTYTIGTPRGDQEMVVINESGFYSLLFRSRKPNAAEFKRWLTCEVLPSIRKHGCYPAPDAGPALQLDREGPWDDQNTTSIGERFLRERRRWEAETGYELAKVVPTMSKQLVSAIERDLGGLRKGRRIEFLLYAGIDILYVLTGTRTMTATERVLRDAYRNADVSVRAKALAPLLALPPVDDVDFLEKITDYLIQ